MHGHSVLRQVDHGLGAGHVVVQSWLPDVGLPLLPLQEVPHGVVSHGAALVRRGGTQGLLVQRRRDAADAVPLGQAVPGNTAVGFTVLRHVRHPVARHVPRQRLVRCDTGKKKKRKEKGPYKINDHHRYFITGTVKQAYSHL